MNNITVLGKKHRLQLKKTNMSSLMRLAKQPNELPTPPLEDPPLPEPIEPAPNEDPEPEPVKKPEPSDC